MYPRKKITEENSGLHYLVYTIPTVQLRSPLMSLEFLTAEIMSPPLPCLLPMKFPFESQVEFKPAEPRLKSREEIRKKLAFGSSGATEPEAGTSQRKGESGLNLVSNP